jgi:hypothetical protein
MGQLTEEMAKKIARFRTDIADALLADLNAHEDVDSLAAPGALSLDILISQLSVDGTDAFTLAAPTRTGQRKIVRCVAAANTPAGTLTVTSPDDTTGFVCAASFFFTAVGQEIELEATPALKWRCVRKKRVGSKTIVIGTDVLTGICNMEFLIRTSTTGTVASATTKGLPNGSAIGERIQITEITAADTPHGDLSGTFLDHAGAAKVGLDDFTVAKEGGTFVWTGAAWQLEGQLTSTTLAFV